MKPTLAILILSCLCAVSAFITEAPLIADAGAQTLPPMPPGMAVVAPSTNPPIALAPVTNLVTLAWSNGGGTCTAIFASHDLRQWHPRAITESNQVTLRETNPFCAFTCISLTLKTASQPCTPIIWRATNAP